ncbi:MAG: hypothetical protein ACFCVA_04340 [Gammaproteobacteria bacterium]
MPSPSSSTPFYGAPSSGSALVATASHQRLALDNLIRRELRVSDPNDPQQIANALLERFREDPRAKAIAQEAKGLPFLLSTPVNGMPTVQAPTSSAAELQQAKDDVDRDLQELLTNSLLKDVTPEIEGWAQAVRTAIQEGTTAARFALDPRQRDKAFGIRRQLGNYARMARLVGALTPTMSLTYRKFAQSLDEVAAVLLVMMGEALANIGFNGGRYLLQVPYADLQVRRDAAIYALRNLTGSTQEAYGQNYSWGLHAYRELYEKLEQRGQGELRSLLVEGELSRSMDELIHRASHGSPEGLRQLGATAELQLERFRRLIVIAQTEVPGDWPPLTSFLDAMLLFVNAFETSGGFRLMRIARPPILFYGLYGNTGLGKGEERLLRLALERNLLSEKLDCFLQCDCAAEAVRCQIVLDKILYDIDRAVDLYAVGIEEFGEPEFRASAYSYLIDAVLEQKACKNKEKEGEYREGFPRTSLDAIQGLLRPAAGLNDLWSPPIHQRFEVIRKDVDARGRLEQELCLQFDAESRWKNTIRTMAPECLSFDGTFEVVSETIEKAIENLHDMEKGGLHIDKICRPIQVSVPFTEASSQTRIAKGLELQREESCTKLLEDLNNQTNWLLEDASEKADIEALRRAVTAILKSGCQVPEQTWTKVSTTLLHRLKNLLFKPV